MTFEHYLDCVPSLHRERIQAVFYDLQYRYPSHRIKFYKTPCVCFPILFLNRTTCIGMASRNGYIALYLSDPILLHQLSEQLPNVAHGKGYLHFFDQDEFFNIAQLFPLKQNML